MRLVANMPEGAQISKMLNPIGLDSEALALPQHADHRYGMTVMRRQNESVEIAPDWDLAAQPAPDFDADQRVNS